MPILIWPFQSAPFKSKSTMACDAPRSGDSCACSLTATLGVRSFLMRPVTRPSVRTRPMIMSPAGDTRLAPNS